MKRIPLKNKTTISKTTHFRYMPCKNVVDLENQNFPNQEKKHFRETGKERTDLVYQK